MLLVSLIFDFNKLGLLKSSIRDTISIDTCFGFQPTKRYQPVFAYILVGFSTAGLFKRFEKGSIRF